MIKAIYMALPFALLIMLAINLFQDKVGERLIFLLVFAVTMFLILIALSALVKKMREDQ